MWRRVARLVALVFVGCLAAGCAAGNFDVSPAQAYSGPLHLDPPQMQTATDRLAGAAGRVVQCRTRITGAVDPAGQLHDGAAATSPHAAILAGDALFDGTRTGLRQVRREDTRALFVYFYEGGVRQAVIVHRGHVFDRDRTLGWYVESWARCDYAEFPDKIPGWTWRMQIWLDSANRRAPTYQVVSFGGAKHCDWTSMTFLTLDGGDGVDNAATYVRRPIPGVANFFAKRYRSDVPVPADAVDTGFHRHGKHLWVSADRQRAYVGNRDHAELWPKTIKLLGCA